jgi:hypothetical protein
MSMDVPAGEGRIYLTVRGNIVDVLPARGGPPALIRSKDHHWASPTPAGSFTLGRGGPHVTASWEYSQLPWDTPVRARSDGEWEFYDVQRQAWRIATGAKSVLARRLSASDFSEANEGRSNWYLNDFGPEAFRLIGSRALYLHTTPANERQEEQGREVVLISSHGCIRLLPADRAILSGLGFLQAGVPIVVKGYSEHLLPSTFRELVVRTDERLAHGDGCGSWFPPTEQVSWTITSSVPLLQPPDRSTGCSTRSPSPAPSVAGAGHIGRRPDPSGHA